MGDYYAFLYSDGGFIDATEEFRKEPDLFFVIGLPSEVQIQTNAGELTAGRDTLTVRLSNFRAQKMDVAYTLNDRELSTVRGWSLGADGSTSLFIEAKTRKGFYRFLAIRDSQGPREAWIPVEVRLHVR